MTTQLNPPFIPENAPFTVDQIAWLNGFLAGMYSSQGDNGGLSVAEAETPVKPVKILWGSQTGNSESLAKKAAKQLKTSGFAPSVVDMGDFQPSGLKEEDLVLVITSTYGDGEPPDNAAALHAWLHDEGAPKLENLRYSVLALGDTNYPDFCKCGIEFDDRLAALGAQRIVPRVDADVDFDDPFEAWLGSVAEAAGGLGVESEVSEDTSQESEYGKKNPFPAKVLRNVNLNGDKSSKQTRHVEISLNGSGLSYDPGDALAVLPINDEGYVDDLLRLSGFSGDEDVLAPNGESMTLRQALREQYDVTNLTLKTLKAYDAVAKADDLSVLAEDKEAFKKYAWGRQLIDLFSEFPVTFKSLSEFQSIFSRLAPRLYSISSSPAAHPDEVHVTVGVVSYDAFGRARKGVCSNFLAEHDGETPVRIYFHHTKSFKLPEAPEKPVIMVGPGTGIAPFRAFLEERSATGAKGGNWLFFGDQHEECDFLYREQLERLQADGVLSKLDTAFSRDQAEKIYVQDRMRERGSELYQWLEDGASFYVCGDASRMAKDVDKALHDVIAQHGNLSPEAAIEYVERLKKEKRYLRDVY